MAKIGEQGLVVVGAQWGDEGKGGRTLNLVEQERPNMVIRFGGGNNAGHTQEDEKGNVVKTHLMPVGVLVPGTMNIVGNACYLDPVSFVHEIESIRELGYDVSPSNLLISNAAHLTMVHHVSIDEIREAGKGRQGSTQRGIAPTAGDKYLRVGKRAETMIEGEKNWKELVQAVTNQLKGINTRRKRAGLEPINEHRKLEEFMDCARILGEYVGNATLYVNEEIRNGKTYVGEGHQGTMLDLDHGLYPFGTSANTTATSFLTSMGISTEYAPYVISVLKLTESRVGDGPLMTEVKENQNPELLERLVGERGQPGAEYGTTSGRKRRMAHLNLPEIRYSDLLNGPKAHSATKLDCIPAYGDMALVCVALRNKHNKRKFTDISPSSPSEQGEWEPVYVELPTWREDISSIRDFNKLPVNAQGYINFLVKETGVKIDWVGVGPHRGQYVEL